MHITTDGDNDEHSNWKECDSLFSEAYQLKIFRVDALFTLSAELSMEKDHFMNAGKIYALFKRKYIN